MKNIRKYKIIQNTRRFDLGKPVSQSGYLIGDQSDLSGFDITPGADLSQQINQLRSSNKAGVWTSALLSAIAPITATGMGVKEFGTSIFASVAPKAYLSTNLGNAFVNASTGAAGQISADVAKEVGKLLGLNIANSTTSGALNTVGTALGGATALYGGIQLANALGSYNNYLGTSDLNQMSTRGTAVNKGVKYNVNYGIDENQVDEMTDELNKASNLQMMSSGAGIGAGVGSIIGGPIGAVGGMLVGGLGGLLGGIFGGSKRRKRKVEEAKRKFMLQTMAENEQNEAVAGTQAMRNEFNATHGADSGKSPGQTLGASDYTNIMTPQGPSVGQAQGYASPDEGEINVETGETQYNGSPNPNVQDPRIDNIPVGGNQFDQNVGIPGHTLDVDGISFADKARPFFKANEMIKLASQQLDLEYEEFALQNDNHKHRDQNTKEYMNKRKQQLIQKKKQDLQQLYQQNSQQIALLVQRQSQIQQNDEVPMYDDGLTPILATAAKIPFYFSERNIIGEKGYIPKINTSNYNATPALNILSKLNYNPSSELAGLINQSRLNIYNINQTNRLSAGQKAALKTSAENNLRNVRHNILMDAYNKNAAYKQAYANALMTTGEQQAQREYNAQLQYNQDLAKQNGAYVSNLLQHNKNMLTGVNQLIQDLSTSNYMNKMLRMYDANLNKQQKKIKLNNPVNNTSFNFPWNTKQGEIEDEFKYVLQ